MCAASSNNDWFDHSCSNNFSVLCEFKESASSSTTKSTTTTSTSHTNIMNIPFWYEWNSWSFCQLFRQRNNSNSSNGAEYQILNVSCSQICMFNFETINFNISLIMSSLVTTNETQFLVAKRQAQETVILKIIENVTKITLEKLKEEYQTNFKVQSSLSNVAIIIVFGIIFTIVSIDLCRLYAFIKSNKNKIDKNNENKSERNESKIEEKHLKSELEIAREESDKSGAEKNKKAKIMWKY
jgi:hypothetical protein